MLFAPVLAALIIVMANNRKLMEDLRNKWWQNLLGLVGLIAVLALGIRLVISLVAPRAATSDVTRRGARAPREPMPRRR